MENYRRVQSSDDASRRDNERVLVIQATDNIRQTVHRLLASNQHAQTVLVAEGAAIAKAATIAELVRRRHGNVQPRMQFQWSTSQDVWEPVQALSAKLDSIVVEKRLPSVTIEFAIRNQLNT